MSALERILDLLPPPYAVAADGTLALLLATLAQELDAAQEDIDRLRRAHWIRQNYRLEDARKLGALFRIAPLGWEDLFAYRVRLLALIEARIAGALGPNEIRGFVEQYLRGAEDALGAVLVPGLAAHAEAWAADETRPFFYPLQFVEFPERQRFSTALAARGGMVPVLHRWTETNRGLEDSVATFRVTGLLGGRTNVPVLVNLTTGDMILYADRIPAGVTVSIGRGDGEDARAARATIDGRDVTHRLRSMAGLQLGLPFTPEMLDPAPRLPALPRGPSEWAFLSVGLYDVRGLDHVFFALAGEGLREGRFDETRWDQAIFPSGPIAQLEMAWTETEPASFEVHVPRGVVVEPGGVLAEGAVWQVVEEALADAIASLHAAGVRAAAVFAPFAERQEQIVRTTLPWIRPDPERASPGRRDEVDLGMHFEETRLGRARFE